MHNVSSLSKSRLVREFSLKLQFTYESNQTLISVMHTHFISGFNWRTEDRENTEQRCNFLERDTIT